MATCPARLRHRPYTGTVTRGGPADIREVAGLRMSKVTVGDFDNNVYLLRCLTTGDQLLIDAANERRPAARAGRPGGPVDDRDHPPSLRSRPGARSRHPGHRRRGDRPSRRRPRAAGDPAAPGARRRRDQRRPGAPAGHPPRRPHARVDRAALRADRRGRRAPTCSPATASFPAARATPRRTRSASPR